MNDELVNSFINQSFREGITKFRVNNYSREDIVIHKLLVREKVG